LLPVDVDAPVCPRLLPLCVDCVGLAVDVLHVELSVPGPHPDVGIGVDCVGLGVDVLHVELSVPGPHPGSVGGAADGLEVDVLHVELSVPGPHPDVGVDCGLLVVLHVELSVPGPHPGPASAVGGEGGVPPVLLLGFVGINGGTLITPPVAFPAGFTEPGGTLIMLPGGSIPVLLLVVGAFGPGRTLIMLPGGGVPGAIWAFPNGFSTPPTVTPTLVKLPQTIGPPLPVSPIGGGL